MIYQPIVDLPIYSGSTNVALYSFDSDFSNSCIGKSHPNNMLISLNMKPSWLTWIGIRQNMLGNNFKWMMESSIHAFGHYHGVISISCTIRWHLFSNFSPFHLPVKEKEKQWRMKVLTVAQWLNLNQNNRSVSACWNSVSWENTGCIPPLLMGITDH